RFGLDLEPARHFVLDPKPLAADERKMICCKFLQRLKVRKIGQVIRRPRLRDADDAVCAIAVLQIRIAEETDLPPFHRPPGQTHDVLFGSEAEEIRPPLLWRDDRLTPRWRNRCRRRLAK